jgi:hypothetical protein
MRLRHNGLIVESCPLMTRGGFTVHTYVTKHRDPVDSLVKYFPSGKVFPTREMAIEYGVLAGRRAIDEGLMSL